MQFGGFDIGVCSWSLRPGSIDELLVNLDELDLAHVQIALAPLLDMGPEDRDRAFATIADAGVEIVSGMIGFADENYTTIANIRKTGGFVASTLWPARRDRAIAAAELAAQRNLPIVTVHAGFIPPSGDPDYGNVVARLNELANAYGRVGVELGLETGQENAAELLQFLNDLNNPHVGVNFDPANMILYGAGDPSEAVTILGRHIRHVHIKDATPSTQPGIEWGVEVPFGTGNVDVHRVLRNLADVGYAGPLVIEREAGNQRLTDVARAIDVLAAHLGADPDEDVDEESGDAALA